jgi:hypothetical protein
MRDFIKGAGLAPIVFLVLSLAISGCSPLVDESPELFGPEASDQTAARGLLQGQVTLTGPDPSSVSISSTNTKAYATFILDNGNRNIPYGARVLGVDYSWSASGNGCNGLSKNFSISYESADRFDKVDIPIYMDSGALGSSYSNYTGFFSGYPMYKAKIFFKFELPDGSTRSISPLTVSNMALRITYEYDYRVDVITPPPDTERPSAPVLSGYALRHGIYRDINLSWTPSTDNVGVTKYVLYHNGSAYQTFGASTLSWGYYRIKPFGGTHSFYVRAYDAAGNWRASAAYSYSR